VATAADLAAALSGARPYAEVVFACLDGAPVGFALFFHNFSTFKGKPGIYLEDLFVQPAARGRGVGKRLLAWLARTALERGCARLDWAVLDWNEPSIGFYLGLGAQRLDEWTAFRLTGAPLARLAASAPE
jgi:GNAT superfamily N-acetyltransferase